MRTLLRTACGSIRVVEMDSRYPIWRVPLPAVYDAAAELAKNPEWTPPEPKAREFVYSGDIPVYDERIA